VGSRCIHPSTHPTLFLKTTQGRGSSKTCCWQRTLFDTSPPGCEAEGDAFASTGKKRNLFCDPSLTKHVKKPPMLQTTFGIRSRPHKPVPGGSGDISHPRVDAREAGLSMLTPQVHALWEAGNTGRTRTEQHTWVASLMKHGLWHFNSSAEGEAVNTAAWPEQRHCTGRPIRHQPPVIASPRTPADACACLGRCQKTALGQATGTRCPAPGTRATACAAPRCFGAGG